MRVIMMNHGWLAHIAKTNERDHTQVMRLLFSSDGHVSVAEERNISVHLESPHPKWKD